MTDNYPYYIQEYRYKINPDRYVKYENIPFSLRPNYLYYNSYKDKIAIIQNGIMCFAFKHIDKKTNQIVYIAKNNEIIDTDLDQYKIKNGSLNYKQIK